MYAMTLKPEEKARNILVTVAGRGVILHLSRQMTMGSNPVLYN